MRFLIPSFLGAMLAACSSGMQPIEIVDTFGPGDDLPADTSDPPIEPGVNQPPVADAGDDLAAQLAQVVELDGSASYDPDGDALAFRWAFVELPSSSAAYLINEARVNPSFFVDAEGEYVVELTVDDGESSDVDEVVVTVDAPNGGPVANAGPDQVVDVGDTVQLNGSGSVSPEQKALDFAWTLVSKPTGSAAALDDAASVLPRFTADASGTYVVELRVSDDAGASWSPSDEMRVTASEPSSGGCFSCAAAQAELDRRIQAGDLAAGFGLALLPLLTILRARRVRR